MDLNNLMPGLAKAPVVTLYSVWAPVLYRNLLIDSCDMCDKISLRLYQLHHTFVRSNAFSLTIPG